MTSTMVQVHRRTYQDGANLATVSLAAVSLATTTSLAAVVTQMNWIEPPVSKKDRVTV